MNNKLIQQKIVNSIDDPKTLASLALVSKEFAETVKRRKTLHMAKAKLQKNVAALKTSGQLRKSAVKRMNLSIVTHLGNQKNTDGNVVLKNWAALKPEHGKYTDSRKRKVARHILKKKNKETDKKNGNGSSAKTLNMALRKLRVFDT